MALSKGAKDENVEQEVLEFADVGFHADALSHLRYNLALARGMQDSTLVTEKKV